MTHGLDELMEDDLLSLDEDGKPPEPSRLPNARAIRKLFSKETDADEASAIRRTQIQAMIDGQPPYNQAALNASGQGSRANANFLMGQDLINRACNGYQDILTSSKILMTVDCEYGEAAESADYEAVIQEEATRTIRKWSSFPSRAQQLIRLFVSHGVGIDYFPDTKDFRFDVAGFGDFYIPRQTPASEEDIVYAVARKDMTVVDLFDKIRNEKAAEKMGWNVAAVKKAIGRATTSGSVGEVGEIERFQQQLKNNDLHSVEKFEHVPILGFWVREFDGTYSFALTEKDAPDGEYLFVEYSRYKSAEEAFIFFCYGIGNGTYHSIRGMGHMIFALVQLHNRLMCQKSDGVMLDESVLLQATGNNALQRASLNYLGPFSLMDQGFEVIDRKISGTSDRTLPFLNEVKGLMGQMSSSFNPPEGAYQNQINVEAELEALAGSTSGALDLFYASWDRLIREMVRRIIQGPKSDPLVAEFHRRCERRGVTKDILESVDHANTYAYRALGAGSPSARSIAFKKLLQLLPQLDEIGRKNLIYRFVENLVGHQNAAEFASRSEEPRQNSEASIATLENFALAQGAPIPVLSYQMHGAHVQIHVPELIRIIDGVETGALDPMQNLGGLRAYLDHVAAHGEQLGQDPSQADLFGQVKEAINNLNQIVTNMERKIKAEQRQAAEAGQGAEGQPSEQERLAQIKIDMEEFKFQMMQRKGELEIAIMQAKADQNLALKDAEGASSIYKTQMFPRSDYSERR